MTPEAADALGKRFVNTWRGCALLSEWKEQLEPLDEGRAGTAFVRLRSECQDAPTIAKFLSVYRSLHTGTRETPHRCPGCGQDGAVTVWVDHSGRWLRRSVAACRHDSNPYAWLGQAPAGARHTDPWLDAEQPSPA